MCCHRLSDKCSTGDLDAPAPRGSWEEGGGAAHGEQCSLPSPTTTPTPYPDDCSLICSRVTRAAAGHVIKGHNAKNKSKICITMYVQYCKTQVLFNYFRNAAKSYMLDL